MHPFLAHRNYLKYHQSQAFQEPADQSRESVFSRWAATAMRRWKRRKMVAALNAMDDRLLSDIGLRRAEIRRVVDAFDDRELGMAPVASTQPVSGRSGTCAKQMAPLRTS